MATEILSGSGFDFLDSVVPFAMRPFHENVSSTPEPILQPFERLNAQSNLSGSMSCEDIGRGPFASQGLPHSDMMHVDMSGSQSQELMPRVGSKRSKEPDTSEERKERQAAKNRQTAKAFRNKMDGMKNYSELRVGTLKSWVRGLWEFAIAHRPLLGEASAKRGLRRTQSAPALFSTEGAE